MLLTPGPPKVLRPDQDRILAEIMANLKPPDNSVLSASPTGSGKTVILSEISRRTLLKNNRTAILTDRQEILEQIANAVYAQTGIKPGIIWKENSDWYEQILVIAQSTFHAREMPVDMPPIDVLMIDEAHHANAPTWIHSVERLRPRILIGFTATPFRNDKEPLTPKPFAVAIRPITPKELIDAKLLVPPVIESLVTYGPDRQRKPIGQAKNLPALYRDTALYAIAQGRTKIVLYVSRTPDHTPTQVMAQTVALLEQAGVTATSVHQDQSVNTRKRSIRRFSHAPGASVLVNYHHRDRGHRHTVHRLHHHRPRDPVGEHHHPDDRPGPPNSRDQDRLPGPSSTPTATTWPTSSTTGASTAKKVQGAGGTKQPKKLATADMDHLSVQFKQKISPLGTAQVDFPWFPAVQQTSPFWPSPCRATTTPEPTSPPSPRPTAPGG